MNGERAQLSWERARAANLANWNERAGLHELAYGLERYDDPTTLSEVVTDDLPVLSGHLDGGTVAGLDVCHLQCHIGTDTLSLARAGARVVGVDFSQPALDAAQRLARRTGADIRWVCADVMDAAAAVADEFDVVYTSIGALCWLSDLPRWAGQVAALLRPGGILFVRDGHPLLYALDEQADDLVLRYPYFGDGRAQIWDDESTYAGDGRVENTRTYEWPHSLSEIVTAVLAAGLRLELLDEGRVLPWRFAPRMREVPGGYAFGPDERDRVPCTFTIIARRV